MSRPEGPTIFNKLPHRVIAPQGYLSVSYIPAQPAFNLIDRESIERLRRKTMDIIHKENPIYITGFSRYGDNMIYRWVVDYVLKKLCQEENCDSKAIKIVSYDSTSTAPKGNFDLSREVAASPVISTYYYPFHFLHDLLFMHGNALGLKLEEIDMRLVPQPIRTDRGPLISFNREEAIKRGEAIRSKAKGPIIVVAQSGSTPEKRFSDSQVMELVETVRQQLPEAQVKAVSDKRFVKNDSDPEGQKYQKAGVEAVVSKNINEITANFYAADLIVATDSYWAWLSAGCKALRNEAGGFISPKDLIVLHTTGHPVRWAVPGANAIRSDVLNWGNLDYTGSISSKDYHAFYNDDQTKKGINQTDIETVKSQLKRLRNLLS